MSALAPVLEGYFTDWLAARGASPNTVASYRDSFALLLVYAHQHTGKAPAQLDLADIDVGLVGGFLDHLQTDRANSARSRNLRLAAVQSLFRYAALRCPEHAGLIARVLAIPTKKDRIEIVTFLERVEVEALLGVPDRSTALGERDYLLLLLGLQTGLRVSELTGANCGDVTFGAGANIACWGKGRKERRTPLTSSTAKAVSAWIVRRGARPGDPLFPNRFGGRLSTDAVADLIDKYSAACPNLAGKRVTPHTLRHTAAMSLLRAGVDTSTIALWLGHASTKATQAYLHADLKAKEEALARTAPIETKGLRYRPTDKLLAFLEAL